MNDFILIFRRDFQSEEAQPKGEQLQEHLQQWQDWFKTLTDQGKLARPLQRWDGDGKIVKGTQSVINGPYVEIKESIGGLIIVKAADYDEATEIAKGCPILNLGGNVEVRKGF